MIKKILKANYAQNGLAFLASLYIRFVHMTTCWQKLQFQIPASYLQNKKPFLTCFWHAHLLMLPYAWRHKSNPFYMLISAHKDGRIISKTVEHFGIHTVPGSTARGGTEALLNMVRLSRKNATIGITPDGPRGPGKEVSEGTVMAAYLMKADLIPVAYTVSRKKIFKTWDQFLLPFPFSRGVFMWGDPIPYPKHKKEFSTTQAHLKKALDHLYAQAEKKLTSCS